jgi:hypothetical protein
MDELKKLKKRIFILRNSQKMNNTDVIEDAKARNLFVNIKNKPISGVEKRIKHKEREMQKFLIEQNLDESNDLELIHDVACLSEVGYSMRHDIQEPFVTNIKSDNGFEYDFSLSPFNGTLFPFDVICIGIEKNEDHVVFIFDIDTFIGAHINGVPVEYKGVRYYG